MHDNVARSPNANDQLVGCIHARETMTLCGNAQFLISGVDTQQIKASHLNEVTKFDDYARDKKLRVHTAHKIVSQCTWVPALLLFQASFQPPFTQKFTRRKTHGAKFVTKDVEHTSPCEVQFVRRSSGILVYIPGIRIPALHMA